MLHWRNPWAILALFAAVLLTLVPGPAAAQTQERDMFVSAVNRAGEPVASLGPADFVIQEDGRRREILRVRRATDLIDLAVLVDTSAAADQQVNDLRMALEAFIGRMREQSHIALIEYGDRPRVLTDYTRDAGLLKTGLGMVFSKPGSGAYVLEALVDTLNGRKKRDAERSAAVVVWLGGREFSTLGYDAVQSGLIAQGTALHVVTVSRGAASDAMTDEGRNRDRVFDTGSSLSGGSRRNVLSSMALKDALDKVATELLAQYRITYARPQTLIPPEKIDIRAARPDLTVRGTPVRVKAGPSK